MGNFLQRMGTRNAGPTYFVHVRLQQEITYQMGD
jgi:hypothetical protein